MRVQEDIQRIADHKSGTSGRTHRTTERCHKVAPHEDKKRTLASHARWSFTCPRHSSRHQMKSFIHHHHPESDTVIVPILQAKQLGTERLSERNLIPAWRWRTCPESWAVHTCLVSWNDFFSLLYFSGPIVASPGHPPFPSSGPLHTYVFTLSSSWSKNTLRIYFGLCHWIYNYQLIYVSLTTLCP